MKLREITRKYLNREWERKDLDKIERRKKKIAKTLMARAGYTGEDVEKLVTNPNSAKAKKLRDRYLSQTKNIYWRKKIEQLDELAELNYIGDLFPSIAQGFLDSDVYLTNYEVTFGIHHKDRSLSISTEKSFLEIQKIKDLVYGIVMVVPICDVPSVLLPLKEFSSKKVKEKLGELKKELELEVISYDFEAETDWGSIEFSKYQEDKPRLFMIATKYTPSLEKVLERLGLLKE